MLFDWKDLLQERQVPQGRLRSFSGMATGPTVLDEGGKSIVLKAAGALLLAILTAVLTVSGEFLVEGRKANLDIWKAVQNIQLQLSQDKERRQVEALYEIQSELKILEGQLVFISREAKPLRSPGSVRKSAAEAGRTMSRIYARVAILDATLETAETAKPLLGNLSMVLADISTKPSRTNVSKFLDYYSNEFGTALAAALRSVQADQNRLESQNAPRAE
jgi:hypothetical protein